jgi:methylglutaconyl-CoA hydratase
MATEAVQYEVKNRFAWITLNMPERRNAFGFAIVQGLDKALERGLGDKDVRGLVLTHTGSVFCAGADLKMNRFDAQAPGSGGKSFADSIHAIWEQLWSAPKPLLARLAGGAYGAGIGLVSSCDIAVAAEGVEFAISELRWGRAGGHMALRLWLKGMQQAAHPYFLTGERFGARVAEKIGFVHQVVPAGGLDAAIEDWIARLRMSAPGAMAQYKANLRALADLTASEAFARQDKLAQQMFTGQNEEFAEGKAAFQEKRKPKWAL